MTTQAGLFTDADAAHAPLAGGACVGCGKPIRGVLMIVACEGDPNAQAYCSKCFEAWAPSLRAEGRTAYRQEGLGL